ncbi:coenzyme A pyrophosphatase [Sphingobacteriaceae bacterium]|nr:coenzyme A pyrophosphatase [Sphingobacteriaceae bacterium]
MEQLVNRLKTALSETLPGIDAQYMMAPLNRQRMNQEQLKTQNYRPSAVMIVFCENANGDLYIPLTERMTYNGAHSGQVSLPGGKFEPEDLDLMNTAIRECFEEIGVKEIDVIGKLTPLHVPVSSFLIHPYVGICKIKDPVMVNQEREVKRLIKLAVTDLLEDSIVKEGSMQVMESLSIKTPWFEVEELKVWGATAMILSELKQILKLIS